MMLRPLTALSSVFAADDLARKRRAVRPSAPVAATTLEESPLRDALMQYLESLP